MAKERAADYDRLRELIEVGSVVPALERTYPLDRVGDAMRRLARGDIRGKVALTP
jgi:D-arabinose 1-dehydrogenase-like Zn-dependent alcohol dehydrogenase